MINETTQAIARIIKQAQRGETVTVTDPDYPAGHEYHHPMGDGMLIILGRDPSGWRGWPRVRGARAEMARLDEIRELNHDRLVHEATHCRPDVIRWAT